MYLYRCFLGRSCVETSRNRPSHWEKGGRRCYRPTGNIFEDLHAWLNLGYQ